MRNIKLNFIIRINNYKMVPKKKKIKQWIKKILTKKCELTICLVTIEEIKKMNLTYRYKNTPTNILSFPYQIPKYIKSYLLGDLVICPEILKKESFIQNKKLETHWAHIIIHGVLHLLGYNHNNTKKQNIMERVEIKTMKQLGYKNPYIL